MNKKIYTLIAQLTGITERQVEQTIQLLDEGATIPFISRYRKERTGGLDELQIGAISGLWDKLNELDTSGVEPMSHVFSVQNVFREDVVTNQDDRENILANAPSEQDGAFTVPRTFD